MEKYGAVLDDEKVKQASAGEQKNLCPLCGQDCGEAKVCPIHGQEGFEKKPDDRRD